MKDNIIYPILTTQTIEGTTFTIEFEYYYDEELEDFYVDEELGNKNLAKLKIAYAFHAHKPLPNNFKTTKPRKKKVSNELTITQIKYILMHDDKVLCHKGFKPVDKINYSEVRLFVKPSTAKEFFINTYPYIDINECITKKVIVTIKEVETDD